MSDAALSHLHLVLRREAVSQSLLRNRLALRAVAACVGLKGRPERAGALRNAVHLLRSGDLSGPAGEVYLCWRHGVERPISVKALYQALPDTEPNRIAAWTDAAQGAPIAGRRWCWRRSLQLRRAARICGWLATAR